MAILLFEVTMGHTMHKWHNVQRYNAVGIPDSVLLNQGPPQDFFRRILHPPNSRRKIGNRYYPRFSVKLCFITN